MIQFDPVLVHRWLSHTAQRKPEKTALVAGERRLSYAGVDTLSDQCACALAEAGVRRGDRVVVLLDNSVETVIAAYGILKAGAVAVILEGSVKGRKLAYVLDNAGAVALVSHTAKEDVVRNGMRASHAPRLPVIWVGEPAGLDRAVGDREYIWDAFLGSRPLSARDSLPRSIDVDLAMLIYTSGSTGEPKGVMSTHHNVVSAARSIIQYLDNEPDDVILDMLPLSFDYGLYQVIMAFMIGATVVLERSFAYPERTLQIAVREGVTGLPIVPAVASRLFRLRDPSRYDLGALRYITNTGAALPMAYIRRLRKMFPQARVFSMFGLTECKRVCFLPPAELDRRPSSVGKAMPNCETLVVDEQGNETAPGQSGELVVRGANVMQGYWRAPEVTSRMYKAGAYPADRRLHTGDYFKRDREGYLYFLGRKDDMIKSGGERISAKEIENVLCSMEGVDEAAAVGVADSVLGQVVKAYVSLLPAADITPMDVQRFCRDNLEDFMVPRYVEIVEHLPKTPHGKLDKKPLAAGEA